MTPPRTPAPPVFPILPGAAGEVTLGVVGGGQLGRMFVQAAQAMGYFTAVLDPDATSPAGRIATNTSAAATAMPKAWPSWPASAPPSPPSLKTCPLPA